VSVRLPSLTALLALIASCAAPPSGHSPAADTLIDGAKTPEERTQLIAVRDQVDAEKRAEAAALDAEIERLTRENAELRKRR
jgi:hypothetical protein